MYAMDFENGDYDPLYAALLLSILGVSNTVGRIISGYIGTKSWVDSLVINNIALLLAGGVTMALPFCDTFSLHSLFAVVFGICVGKRRQPYVILFKPGHCHINFVDEHTSLYCHLNQYQSTYDI